MGSKHDPTRISGKGITVMALIASSLAACDAPDQAPIQRDIYAGQNAAEAMQNCIADWGNEGLCTSMADAKAREAAAQQHASGGGHSGGSFVYIQGPGYSGERVVTYGGNRYVPRSASTPSFPSSPVATSGFSKSGAFTGSVARGGFGSVGHAAGGVSS